MCPRGAEAQISEGTLVVLQRQNPPGKWGPGFPGLAAGETSVRGEATHTGCVWTDTLAPLLSTRLCAAPWLRPLTPKPWPNFKLGLGSRRLGQGLPASHRGPGACPRPSCACSCLASMGRGTWSRVWGPKLLPGTKATHTAWTVVDSTSQMHKHAAPRRARPWDVRKVP